MQTWLDAYAKRALTDSPAVVETGAVLTSRELTELAVDANFWLDAIGAPAGRPVAALLSTTREAFALTLAGASSGRAMAPLGVRSTVAEVNKALVPLAPAVLVAEPGAADLAHAAVVGTEIKVHIHPTFELGRGTNLNLTMPGDAPAAILHTSGTSGQPKPVPYPQHRLLLRMIVNSQTLGLGEGSVYATASPFHHIAGLGMLFVALGAGAALCPLTKFTVDNWDEVIGRGTTHALLVPSMIEQLMDENRLVRGKLQCLQYGASKIDPDTLGRLLNALPGLDLVQIYGQTEGSPISVLTTSDHAAAGDTRLLSSAGRAAPGVTLVINEPDADGIGEVWAKADHLMKPDADGWLRTGDVGTLDPDGYLTIVGRKGDMIIRGGENVYPSEVEEVIRKHPEVADVAVIGVADKRLGQTIAAYVVPRDIAAPPDTQELHRFTRDVLAGFKVPQHWEFIAELPRNAAGKVLKRMLGPNGDK